MYSFVLHMCVIVAFRNVQLFGMRGADVIMLSEQVCSWQSWLAQSCECNAKMALFAFTQSSVLSV